MVQSRTVEYVFFFALLGVTAYVMWQIIAPFFSALAVAGAIVTASYPFYRKVLARMPRHNRSLASLVMLILIGLLAVVPLAILGYLIFSEALTLYTVLHQPNSTVLSEITTRVEALVQYVAPSYTLDTAFYLREGAGWLVTHSGAIFAGTASTVFFVFISVIAAFYFFRDGETCIRYLKDVSPLSEREDSHIIRRLSQSVRSVVLGTLAVALIQGVLTAIGFAIFGIGQPGLWGATAAIGSLIPGVGTLIVFVPAIVYLLFTGSYGTAIGLAIWGSLAVGMIDNVLGPYLMSRGGSLHPFFVLLAVLGGIGVFGPMGFILGPVTLSLFTVLLELYSNYVSREEKGV